MSRPTPGKVRALVEALEDAVTDYEQAVADPMGEANEAAQAVAEACLALRKARGRVTQ
ncbi:hypothetical protein [Micromonospora sp. WMMD737]|uniref:hypothetical protein n=1 Tax=Micromonospora sp. WMMD737 TaxID=3404113 RepID=UPI003B9600E8